MKKTLLASALFLFTSVGMAQPMPTHSNALSTVAWQDIPLAQTRQISVSAKQNQAFTKHFAGTESPVLAYRLPADQGTLQIEMTSAVIDQQVFVPSVVILDSKFNVAARYPSSHFSFQEARGLQPHRFEAQFKVTPVAGQDALYLLIYTTADALGKTTKVPHPAKAFAKATGKQPPAIPDLMVQHSREGVIKVKVSKVEGETLIGLPTTLFEKSHSKPTHKTAQPVEKMSTPNMVTVAIDKDTVAYFEQAVKKALKQNDINKALNLVNEAEKLGLTTPRQIFLKQVSSK